MNQKIDCKSTNYVSGGIDAVRTFMDACGQTTNTKPTYPTAADALLRCKLTLEETTEFVTACLKSSCASYKNANDVLQHLAFAMNSLEEFIKDEKPDTIPVDMKEALDAIVDIEYVNLGAGVTFGFNVNEAFDRVQKSNMSKLGDDGKAIKNEAGKVLKGPNYVPPDLSDLYE